MDGEKRWRSLSDGSERTEARESPRSALPIPATRTRARNARDSASDVDPWGRPIHAPQDREQRIAALRRLAGSLQAAKGVDEQWLGRTLGDWLHNGGTLEDALGIRPERGSRATIQRLIRDEERDRLLVRFAARIGNDRRALRILRGIDACPVQLQEQVERLRAMKVPTSAGSISRARSRSAAAHG